MDPLLLDVLCHTLADEEVEVAAKAAMVLDLVRGHLH